MPVKALQRFGAEHVGPFLQLAATEGWISDRAELDFLRRNFPLGCLVATIDGEPAAFVTALQHSASAWIGNLLVTPSHRRQGLGRRLMEEVLRRLDAGGCDTVWLTASQEGSPLYRSLGFVPLDSVQRWRATGSPAVELLSSVDLDQAAVIDRLGWGDLRPALFNGQQAGAGWRMGQDGFLCCLPGDNGVQLGPWGALTAKSAGKLLDQVMSRAAGEGSILLDAPAGNWASARLLQRYGFAISGTTLLMYRGRKPEYRPEFIYALASMGSYG